MKLVSHDGKRPYHPCEYYNWRLDWLEKQISIRHNRGEKIPENQYQRWFDEEEKAYQNQLRDYEKIQKLEKDTCIIVPTHYYHAPWLRACLEACQKTGLFVVLAYDNPIYAPNQDLNIRFPNAKTLLLADYISVKHKTWGSGVGIPHSFNMWYGLKMVKALGFDYVFNINGDCVMEKPEGLGKLKEMLGMADIISCEYHPGRYIGTMAWLAKTDVAVKLWDMNMENLYRNNLGNAEARMGIFANRLNLDVVPVKNPSDHHFKDWTHDNTFRKVLGIRHLHAEHKVRRWNKKEPIEEHFCEKQYLNLHEKNSLEKYWKTGDRKYLEKWWS